MRFHPSWIMGLLWLLFASGLAARPIHLQFPDRPMGEEKAMTWDHLRFAEVWEQSGHPLDSALQACMTTGDQMNLEAWLCCLEYTGLWEKEVDRLYKLLLTQSKTDFEEDRLLAMAQKNWVKFKNAQFAYIELQYIGDEGTMYERRRAWERFAIVRARGLMLYAHYVGMSGDR
jgi:uncharacterized protein YecT (DUF1311 family)